jgi:hypothetical protein
MDILFLPASISGFPTNKVTGVHLFPRLHSATGATSAHTILVRVSAPDELREDTVEFADEGTTHGML